MQPMYTTEKAERGDTSCRPRPACSRRVVEDLNARRGNSLASTPVVVLSAILGRIPTMEEYESAVEGINPLKFAPPLEAMSN